MQIGYFSYIISSLQENAEIIKYQPVRDDFQKRLIKTDFLPHQNCLHLFINWSVFTFYYLQYVGELAYAQRIFIIDHI